jgi:hypothetical protein
VKAVHPELDDICSQHAKFIIACDFFVVVTATFRLVYVFIVMEIGTRRILHLNVTMHPNAEWTMQQFRECLTGEERYRFVIHDRDYLLEGRGSFAEDDRTANSENTRAVTASQCFCERLIGSFVMDNKSTVLLRIPLCGSEARATYQA